MEDVMQQGQKKSGLAIAAIVLILLLPLFYVLSIGPVIWAHGHDLVSDEWLDSIWSIYKPLEAATDMFPRATTPLFWYVDLWDGPDVTPVNAPLPQPPIPAGPSNDVDVPFELP
jgi:hypothetical protein